MTYTASADTTPATLAYIAQMVVLHSKGKDHPLALLYSRHPEDGPIPIGGHPDGLILVAAMPVWQLPRTLQKMVASAPWILTTAHTLKLYRTDRNPEGVRYYPA